ncbi:MAG: hypothetical protein K0R50_2470 [Eubacterium sp.]|nr:hypothetical protein [Eubacterium sp.]
MDNRVKSKLTDITSKNESGISSFSIAYSGKKMDNSEVSYEIISALKAGTDMFIELNSSLLNMEHYDKKNLAEQFTEGLQHLGIEHRNKKVFNDASRKILSITLESKKVEGFEICALIPKEIWGDPEIRKLIPKSGVRYYLPLEETENNLSAFVELSEEEKLEICRMVIFDHIMLATMGIKTVHLSKNDIDQLINKG